MSTDASKSQGCTIPPPGWFCTRKPGHDGPCAAHAMSSSPAEEDDSPLTPAELKLIDDAWKEHAKAIRPDAPSNAEGAAVIEQARAALLDAHGVLYALTNPQDSTGRSLATLRKKAIAAEIKARYAIRAIDNAPAATPTAGNGDSQGKHPHP